MEPWYKIATPRKEVREGRSFNPDEFAIALEQVVAGTAPEDYRLPAQFFARTCFTRALTEHLGLTLRRLAGETANTAPVMALITQFGGGKTHTLTALYHLIHHPAETARIPNVQELLARHSLAEAPAARVAVFVGNAWDPAPGRETPWLDLAWQLAGADGVEALGAEARSKAPGTTNLRKLFDAAGGRVLVLCDEVLNFLSRHRDMADGFRDFLANLVRALTGATGCAAMISLPQSKPEMNDHDLRWQEIIAKEVGRVAKQLISNDEAEISEVVRRRLFEDLGSQKTRANVAKSYADWCFERRAQLPPEWTAVDTASTEAKSRDYLRARFEACYPFHPATLSVFQRKWQMLPQYQQTRGTLAMLAQWISWAYQKGYRKAHPQPLITLGDAPLEIPEFRSVIIGQLGEPRLLPAIDADIAGENSHARALDADTKGPLKDIHRRAGAAILFESSGGQTDKVAHLPELRFALGEPSVDTTSIDNAAQALEDRAFFIRKAGSDGFRIGHKPTLKQVVSRRRASLDDEKEVRPAMCKLVLEEFKRGAGAPLAPFPEDGAAVADTPRLTLVLLDPAVEWPGGDALRKQIADWTRQRGQSPRLYPAAPIWCLKKCGRNLRDSVETWLAWKRVAHEIGDGTLGGDFDKEDRVNIQGELTDAEGVARESVWGDYRYIVIHDPHEPDGVKAIDLGAGHSSSAETLCGRVITALKSQALLSESVGVGYIEQHWPPAFQESGAWPLSGLRQSFLNGSLTRLLDPDSALKSKIPQFVEKGDFGLAAGLQPDGSYSRIWFREPISSDEVAFDSGIVLLQKAKAAALSVPVTDGDGPGPGRPAPVTIPAPPSIPPSEPVPPSASTTERRQFRLRGRIPPEIWNRLGTRILPKLRTGSDLTVGIDFSVSVSSAEARQFAEDLRQILADLGLAEQIRID